MKPVTTAEACQTTAHLAPLESQREYRQRLSAFIRMHNARLKALDSGISHAALPVNSMLILAQTGCGKSFTAARLCEAAGVNLVTVDCSSLTKTGYKGCNLGELLYSSCKNASDNTIILFDEMDKMRIDNPEGNPQVNFLKLFEGSVQADPRGSSPVMVDVSRMSFLFAGAFSGLEDIIRRRLTPRTIGFSARSTNSAAEKEPLSLATMADIREYGFMDELLGRIGSILYIPPLTPADYRTLLKGSTGSVQARYENLLTPSGVSLSISDSACAHIAREAARSPLGARSVDPIVYRVLQGAFEKLDTDRTINRVTISCRDDHLALLYGHGERLQAEEPEEESPRINAPLPDVSIARYLKDEEGIQELCDLALQAFDRPDSYEERLFLIFLKCCFRYMRTLSREEDKVLSSVSKLANTTKPDKENESCFDRIINEALEYKKLPNPQRNKLFEAHIDFCAKRSDENHEFWVSATKDMRRNWYKYLLQKAC